MGLEGLNQKVQDLNEVIKQLRNETKELKAKEEYSTKTLREKLASKDQEAN